MSEDIHPTPMIHASRDQRYSLKEMMEEVQVERRESHFGRQLVDSTEIDKMFGKRKRKKKKKTE